MQKNILVIGGNSLIGREVINLASVKGDNVIATSRSIIDISIDNFIQLDPNGDLSSLDSLPESIDGLLYCPGSISLKSIQRLDIESLEPFSALIPSSSEEKYVLAMFPAMS